MSLTTAFGIPYIQTNVNAKNTQSIALTPLSSRLWKPQIIRVWFKAVAGMSVTFSASFGTNSTDFDNLCAIAAVGSAGSVTNDGASVTISAFKALDISTNALTMKITTGATATTCNVDVEVFGTYGEP